MFRSASCCWVLEHEAVPFHVAVLVLNQTPNTSVRLSLIPPSPVFVLWPLTSSLLISVELDDSESTSLPLYVCIDGVSLVSVSPCRSLCCFTFASLTLCSAGGGTGGSHLCQSVETLCFWSRPCCSHVCSSVVFKLGAKSAARLSSTFSFNTFKRHEGKSTLKGQFTQNSKLHISCSL